MIGVSRNRKSPPRRRRWTHKEACHDRHRRFGIVRDRHRQAGCLWGVDSGGGWAAFRIRKAKADPPRPARGSLGRRAKDYSAKSYRFRPQAGICDPCIDAPGLGRLNNSLSEGFNDEAKTLKKAVASYQTSSASGSGYPSSSAKATPGNEGDSKNKQAPGKVGEPL